MVDPTEEIEFVPTAAERITLSVAEQIISKTVQRSRKAGRPPPDPLVLVSVVQRVLVEYEVRDFIDAMPSLQQLKKTFDRLEREVSAARKQILSILSGRGISYFFEVAIAGSPYDPSVMERVEEGPRLLADIALHAKAVNGELEALLQSGASRWYELGGGSPIKWLYSEALPGIFEEVFGGRYGIPSEEKGTSPGLRFAVAMMDAAHLPRIGQNSLRIYASKKSRVKVEKT